MDLQTTTRVELIDIIGRVRAAVKESGIKDGSISADATEFIPAVV